MKLLIADDHPIFRKGLKDILQQSFSTVEIIECEAGDKTLEIIRLEKPDVAVLDIDMPHINGLDICQTVYSEGLPTRIIILTMYKEEEMFNKAFLTGAMGYVVKDNSVVEIVECIKEVMLGKKFIGPALQGFLTKFKEADKKKDRIRELLHSLTQAELKTLKLVSQNRASKEIAELLFVSVKTVENYRSRICKKLELDPRNNSLLLWVSENRELLATIKEF
ncbi:MAG TPA: response regulator transcription factor [Flavobacteriales bacterium]|nr:response regulator transcription factor [Flavobacteriales bacterium]HRE95227.1 response regulator transcription factor [Flavobacteriales bacterium]HRJ34666.1 response regulator transcription factor [Flavobacteriales bacterium]HRJ38195.1 response regulator transcription factor [Flavobacteriales bacterium]